MKRTIYPGVINNLSFPEVLKNIFWDIKRSEGDSKVYVSEKAIIYLFQLGGEITANHEQISGTWLTEVLVGKMLFTHSSKKRLIK